MNANAETAGATPVLVKPFAGLPAIAPTGDSVQIRTGVVFNGRAVGDLVLGAPQGGFLAGTDYAVLVPGDGAAAIAPLDALPLPPEVLGGFHYAPGGNATERSGGSTTPAINEFSVWDVSFRPACPDPRGMALVSAFAGLGVGVSPFSCDIYLTAAAHRVGTSRFGVTIADGGDLPSPMDEGATPFSRFDYDTATKVLAHHGKQLLSYDEYRLAAYGVTERTAAGVDPEKTGLDAARTSRFGLMQATGNLWQWGHDGDPDVPRASIFGGSWWLGGGAGSRRAYLASPWPDHSYEDWGARGRCDHLQLA
jgi:hypothetical protein